jgi:hypothetical protein
MRGPKGSGFRVHGFELEIKQMQDARVQDAGSTLWERLSSRDLSERVGV